MKKLRVFGVFLLLCLLLSNCKTQKKIVNESPSRNEINYYTAQYNELSSKFEATLKDEKQNTSVKGTLKIKKDSIIWASIAPLMGIEVARIQLTPDSIKVINKLDNSYFLGKYEFIQSIFNVSADYYLVQSIIIGTDLKNYEKSEIERLEDNDYIIYFFKVKQKNTKTPPIKQTLKINKKNNLLVENSIQDEKNKYSIMATYSEYVKTETEQQIPSKINIILNADKQFSIEITLKNITLNKPFNYPFNIPQGYKPMF